MKVFYMMAATDLHHPRDLPELTLYHTRGQVIDAVIELLDYAGVTTPLEELADEHNSMPDVSWSPETWDGKNIVVFELDEFIIEIGCRELEALARAGSLTVR